MGLSVYAEVKYKTTYKINGIRQGFNVVVRFLRFTSSGKTLTKQTCHLYCNTRATTKETIQRDLVRYTIGKLKWSFKKS